MAFLCLGTSCSSCSHAFQRDSSSRSSYSLIYRHQCCRFHKFVQRPLQIHQIENVFNLGFCPDLFHLHHARNLYHQLVERRISALIHCTQSMGDVTGLFHYSLCLHSCMFGALLFFKKIFSKSLGCLHWWSLVRPCPTKTNSIKR